MTWLLVIYTLPAEPSRKRAFVWRELNKAGALYLRDGVCALPEREVTVAALRAIVAKIAEFDGQATLVTGAQIDGRTATALIEQFGTARAREYAEVAQAAEGFLAHIQRETEHRDFSNAEVEELETDLGKIRRWFGQVRARDYFGADEAGRVAALLTRGEEALGVFLEAASNHAEIAP
ncbi:MAG: Chromate resistance protein ChrB [Chloroflexota bacterium]